MLGKVKSGTVQLLTFGGLGIWAFIDLILIASRCKENNIKSNRKKESNVAIIACILVLTLNISALIIGVNNINDLKLKLLNVIVEEENKVFDGYDDFIDYINSNRKMQVFMEYDATDEEIRELKEDLSKIEGVNSITFVSKEDAYNTMKEKIGNPTVMEGIELDVFSVSYEIGIADLEMCNEIYNEIILLENVREVRSDYETAKSYNNIKTTINVGVIFAVVLVVLHTMILISTIYIIKNNIIYN